MEEDFSLSLNGADIQKKMPLSSPSCIGISQLNLLKSDLVPSNSQSFSENLVIKRADFPRNSFQIHENNSNTPIPSINLRSNHSELFSIDKELMGMIEKPQNSQENSSDNRNAQYIASKPSNFFEKEAANSQKIAKYRSGAVNVLKQYPVIKKIIDRFEENTSFRKKPASFNGLHLRFLNDSCYFLNKPQKFIKLSQFLSPKDLKPYKKLRKLTKKLENRVRALKPEVLCAVCRKFVQLLENFTFFEYNFAKILLEVAKLVIFCYFFGEFSFEIAANRETREKYQFLTKFAVLLVLSFEFFANSLLKSRKLFEDVSEFKRNRENPRNYADFFCKLVGLLSVFLYFALESSSFSRFFNVLLVFYCGDIRKSANLLALLAKKHDFCEKLLEFLELFLQFFALVHCICCSAHLFGFFAEISLKDQEITYFQSIIASIRIFFVPLQTNPSVSLQITHVFLLFLWIFTLFFTIFSVFSRFFSIKPAKTQENLLKNYMKFNKLPLSLQLDLLKYSETLQKTRETEDFSESLRFIDSFHKSLRKKVMRHSSSINLANYSLLMSNFSKKTSNKLINKLTYRFLKPGEFLYKQGDFFEPCLYLVLKGSIELSLINAKSRKEMLVFQRIQNLQCVNEFEFLTGNPYRFSARSCCFSSILQLKREDFLEIVRQVPADFEYFCMARDQILLYADISQISERCVACGISADHFSAACPLTHYIPAKTAIISRYSYSSAQQRQKFSRKFKKRQNSLYFAAQNRYFAAQVSFEAANRQRSFEESDELEAGYQEQSSLMYPSDYSVESEDDFSEEELGKPKAKSSNTLPSIKREKVDSLEVINEESKIGTLPINTRSNVEIPASNANLFGFQEDSPNKFNTKLLETKAFDTKRNVSATEIKIESKIMTEGGKMFEDYLKRNSLLSKQSSIAKNTQSVASELQLNKQNPHYKNVNAVLSLTENKSWKRRNSIMVNTANTNNTGTKSNKSSKASKATGFDLFMEFDAVGRFCNYFPQNNCEKIVEKMAEMRNFARSCRKNARSTLQKKEENSRKSLQNQEKSANSQRKREEDRSFKDVKTLDSKKSHFVNFKKTGKKTSLEFEAKRLFY